jgi:hypothetical protein
MGSTSQWLVTLSGRIALIVVHKLVVRPQAVVSVLAPERAIIAVWNRGIPGSLDEHTLPAQIRATVFADIREPGALTRGPRHVFTLGPGAHRFEQSAFYRHARQLHLVTVVAQGLGIGQRRFGGFLR